MKKNVLSLACGLLMAAQAMAVSVNNVCGKFDGNLNVNGDEMTSEVYVLPGTVDNTITFVLPDFHYLGGSLGDIVLVNIPMDENGALTLQHRPFYINASSLKVRADISCTTVEEAGEIYSSVLSESNVMVLLEIAAPATLPEPIMVLFVGEKQDGANYTMPNLNFEAAFSNYDTEGWHSFTKATGSFTSFLSDSKKQFVAVTNGAQHGGNQSACITTSFPAGVKGNGNMTNCQINAGSMTADDATGNYNFSDPAGAYNTPFVGNPDSIVFWAKYVPAKAEPANASDSQKNLARMHAVITNNTRYQDPETTTAHANAKVAETEINYPPTNGWQRFSLPFNYLRDASEAAYIYITFSTNWKAGGGNAYTTGVISKKYFRDSCYIDEIEFIYNRDLTSLTFEGQNITGNVWSTSKTYSDELYTIEATPSSKGKAFVGYYPDDNCAVVYSIGQNYVNNPANYSVRKIHMAPASTTDISNTSDEAVKAIKFFRNGQLYIRRGNQTYNIQGIRVK